MSTDLASMQSFGDFGGHNSGLHAGMAPVESQLYGLQGCWDPSPLNSEPPTKIANYMHLQVPSNLADTQTTRTTTAEKSNFDDPPSYVAPLIFTNANAMTQQDSATMSPLQTRFTPNQAASNTYTTPAFVDHPAQSSRNHTIQPASSKKMPHLPLDGDVQTRNDSHSPVTNLSGGGRRRKSESLDVGPARAIYLEKNRKAASKCRNKQKRQQEDLVEQARDLERRNKLLRAETEILRGGMRELIDVVGEHFECQDSRLRLYLQYNSDRLLAVGGIQDFSCPQQGQGVSLVHPEMLLPEAAPSSKLQTS